MWNVVRNAPDYLVAGAAYFAAKTLHRTSMPTLSALENIAQVTPSIRRVLGQNPGPFTLQGTNTYLVGSGRRKVLIDTGEPDIPQYIENLRTALGKDEEIEAIIATHWHGDHVGGIPSVWKLIGKRVPVYKFRRLDADDEDPSIFNYVEDGHEISVDGATLKLLYTPGHTTDHMSVLLKEDNILFSGDCILGEGTAIFEDLHTYMNSLNLLLGLQPTRILPGHGQVVENAVAKIEEYIAHRNERESQILAALSSSSPGTVLTSMDLTNAIYAGVPAAVKLAAVMNVRHHLTKLVKEGRVRQEPYDGYVLVARDQ